MHKPVSQQAFSDDSGRSVTSPERVIDIDWLLLTLAEVSSAPLLGSLDGCREFGLRGLSSSALTQATHTKRTKGSHTEAFTVFFGVMIAEHWATMCGCMNLCVLFGYVGVPASACFYWCLNLLYQDKVDYTNPLYCLSLSAFHFSPIPVSVSHHSVLGKNWGLKRETSKAVDKLLLKFYSNSDLVIHVNVHPSSLF